jgi:hypothetical protein
MPDLEKNNPSVNWWTRFCRLLGQYEELRIVLFVFLPLIAFWSFLYFSFPEPPVEVIVNDIELKMEPEADHNIPWNKVLGLEVSKLIIPNYDDFRRRLKNYKKLYFGISSSGDEAYYFAFNEDTNTSMLHKVSFKRPEGNWAYYLSGKLLVFR